MTVVERALAKYRGKEVMLLWSGGMDSNAMLFGLLKVGALVRLVSLESTLLPNVAVEPKVRKLLRDRHLDDYREQILSIETYQQPATKQAGSRFLLQQSVMLTTALMNSVHNSTEYALQAYVMGDDAVSFLDDFKRLWNSQNTLLGRHARQCKLEFPFAKLHKYDLATDVEFCLSGGGERVRSWACEVPTMRFGVPMACLKCPSCRLVSRFSLEKLHFGYDVTREYTTPAELAKYFPQVLGFYHDDRNHQLYVVGVDGKVHNAPLQSYRPHVPNQIPNWNLNEMSRPQLWDAINQRGWGHGLWSAVINKLELTPPDIESKNEYMLSP